MNKKDLGKAYDQFCEEINNIKIFTEQVKENKKDNLTTGSKNLCFDMAIIFLCKKFETFILNCLVTIINNDSTVFSENAGHLKLPKHMNQKVCHYLIYSDGYFNFRNYGGLIKEMRKYISDESIKEIKNHINPKKENQSKKEKKGKETLDLMFPLRNFAAHDSSLAKSKAIESIKEKEKSQRKCLQSSGTWLKQKKNFDEIADNIKEIAYVICKTLSKELRKSREKGTSKDPSSPA